MRCKSTALAGVMLLMGALSARPASAMPVPGDIAPEAPVAQAQFGGFGYGWSPGYYYGPRPYYGPGYGPGPYYGTGYGPGPRFYGPPPRGRLVCRVRPGPYGPREVCWRR